MGRRRYAAESERLRSALEVTVSVRVLKTLGASSTTDAPRSAASFSSAPALGVLARLHEDKNESGVHPRSHGFFDQPHTLDQEPALLAAALRLQQRPGLFDGLVLRLVIMALCP